MTKRIVITITNTKTWGKYANGHIAWNNGYNYRTGWKEAYVGGIVGRQDCPKGYLPVYDQNECMKVVPKLLKTNFFGVVRRRRNGANGYVGQCGLIKQGVFWNTAEKTPNYAGQRRICRKQIIPGKSFVPYNGYSKKIGQLYGRQYRPCPDAALFANNVNSKEGWFVAHINGGQCFKIAANNVEKVRATHGNGQWNYHWAGTTWLPPKKTPMPTKRESCSLTRKQCRTKLKSLGMQLGRPMENLSWTGKHSFKGCYYYRAGYYANTGFYGNVYGNFTHPVKNNEV